MPSNQKIEKRTFWGREKILTRRRSHKIWLQKFFSTNDKKLQKYIFKQDSKNYFLLKRKKNSPVFESYARFKNEKAKTAKEIKKELKIFFKTEFRRKRVPYIFSIVKIRVRMTWRKKGISKSKPSFLKTLWLRKCWESASRAGRMSQLKLAKFLGLQKEGNTRGWEILDSNSATSDSFAIRSNRSAPLREIN